MSDFERRLREAIDGQIWEYIAFAVLLVAMFYFGSFWAFL